jgi:hygromycin-B 7''-O-kinase
VDEVIAAAAARHGLTMDRVSPMPAGVANHVHLLGDNLVLRVPRSPEMAADLRKEAVILPVAHAAGIRTPALVASDDAVPYLVLERVPGADLAGRDRPPGLLRQVGRELAKVHRLRLDLPADGPRVDPRTLIADLRDAGRLDAENAEWLARWFDRLAPPGEARVVVHGDIGPQNLIARGGTLTGIVDWGDAMLADPATDFAKMPLTDVPAMLDGYRSAGGARVSEAGVLWHHLAWALGRLTDPAPRPGERHWTAPPASRLIGLLRFFAAGPPAPWKDLVP